MEKPTAPELILSHIALILIDLDISSPLLLLFSAWQFHLPLGNEQASLLTYSLIGILSPGESSLPWRHAGGGQPAGGIRGGDILEEVWV